jgi:hypothetical protein
MRLRVSPSPAFSSPTDAEFSGLPKTSLLRRRRPADFQVSLNLPPSGGAVSASPGFPWVLQLRRVDFGSPACPGLRTLGLRRRRSILSNRVLHIPVRLWMHPQSRSVIPPAGLLRQMYCRVPSILHRSAAPELRFQFPATSPTEEKVKPAQPVDASAKNGINCGFIGLFSLFRSRTVAT